MSVAVSAAASSINIKPATELAVLVPTSMLLSEKFSHTKVQLASFLLLLMLCVLFACLLADLHVPALLVLNHKGRMGDTFSNRLWCVDMRLRCLFPQSTVSVSTMVQELGRVARYVEAGRSPDLPRLLVSNVMLDYFRSSPCIAALLENSSWMVDR